jgi:SAM-dependent methyltransferase
MIKSIIRYLLVVVQFCFSKPAYRIKRGYRHRVSTDQFDDSHNKDEWQKEVYAQARDFLDESDYCSVLDIGCGSGYKLIKYFGEFAATGVEIEPTLSKLKLKYPHYPWTRLGATFGKSFDMIICSDVIEHVDRPDFFLEQINQNIQFKTIIISTPERDMIRGKNDFGPPKNISHFREWNKKEFHAFISDYFLVNKHYISNAQQGTQVIYAQKR